MEEIKHYFDEMQTIHQYLLHNYLESDDYENTLQSFSIIFPGIRENKHKLKCTLHIIAKMANNHYRSEDFWPKIEKILLFFKENIKQSFSNEEIFTIFKSNKRIILFLLNNNILIPQKTFLLHLSIQKYKNHKYFIFLFNEFKKIYSERFVENNKEIVDDQFFDQKRQIGENCSELCKLIQKDSLNEFISYVNVNDVDLNLKIERSIFETNPFLIKKQPTMIEYSAFFGSIQIFKYLMNMKVEITASTLHYAIHGNNYEIIHMIEENVVLTDQDYNNSYVESIKCHHIELSKYFHDKCSSDFSENNFKIYLKYYNFECLTYFENLDNINQISLLYECCHFDHFIPAQILLHTLKLTKTILSNNFFLLISVKKGNLDIVKTLLNHPLIDVNQTCVKELEQEMKKENHALVCAAKQCHNEIFKLLLEQKNININKKDAIKQKYVKCEYSALFFACIFSNVDLFKLLLERKDLKINDTLEDNVGISRKKNSILYYVVKNCKFEMIQMMINHPKIDLVNCRSTKLDENIFFYKTILYCAIKRKDTNILKLILDKKKIDINEVAFISDVNKEKKKITPLGLAILDQNVEMIHLLLSNEKIDVNRLSKFKNYSDRHNVIKEQKSPLQIAVESKNTEIVNILLNNPKIDVNKKCCSVILNENNIKIYLYIMVLVLIFLFMIYGLYTENKSITLITFVTIQLMCCKKILNYNQFYIISNVHIFWHFDLIFQFYLQFLFL